MSLVASYLFQGLLVGKQTLPAHPLKALLHSLRGLLFDDDVSPGPVRGGLQ
ncbi:MAG TPA: hypothetical protein VEY13_13715 [Rubrobacteraceae bacterium]|nr:hypothetical protein [Rubrobacteraceae bacterium]